VKQITAFIFLVIVNLILLTHAVFPHHHHDSQVCLFDDHCSDDNVAHNHDTDKHGHEHDGNANNLDCLLDEEVIIPSKPYKSQITLQNNGSGLDYHFTLITPAFNYPEVPAIASHSPTDFQEPFTSFFSGHFYGLRAPPLV